MASTIETIHGEEYLRMADLRRSIQIIVDEIQSAGSPEDAQRTAMAGITTLMLATGVLAHPV